MTELTNDQINVKVAELRGWRHHPEDFGIWTSPGQYCEHASPPPVATCANAAMELVEVMRGPKDSPGNNGWSVHISNANHTWSVMFVTPCKRVDATAETLPLAISKAFIAANEGREG